MEAVKNYVVKLTEDEVKRLTEVKDGKSFMDGKPYTINSRNHIVFTGDPVNKHIAGEFCDAWNELDNFLNPKQEAENHRVSIMVVRPIIQDLYPAFFDSNFFF